MKQYFIIKDKKPQAPAPVKTEDSGLAEEISAGSGKVPEDSHDDVPEYLPNDIKTSLIADNLNKHNFSQDFVKPILDKPANILG